MVKNFRLMLSVVVKSESVKSPHLTRLAATIGLTLFSFSLRMNRTVHARLGGRLHTMYHCAANSRL